MVQPLRLLFTKVKEIRQLKKNALSSELLNH